MQFFCSFSFKPIAATSRLMIPRDCSNQSASGRTRYCCIGSAHSFVLALGAAALEKLKSPGFNDIQPRDTLRLYKRTSIHSVKNSSIQRLSSLLPCNCVLEYWSPTGKIRNEDKQNFTHTVRKDLSRE